MDQVFAKDECASMSLKRLVLQINSALTQLLIGLMLGGLWGSGGWAGGRMCPPFLDSNMISSLRASISWAWSCTSCISLCLSLTSAFLAPVNSWPCTREHLRLVFFYCYIQINSYDNCKHHYQIFLYYFLFSYL